MINQKFKILSIIFFICTFCACSSGLASNDTIKWHKYDKGIALGKSTGKTVYIHFSASWCRYCVMMDEKTFKEPSVIEQLSKNYISVKVDCDIEKKTALEYSVRGLPDNIFISEKGEVLYRRPGYISPENLVHILQTLQQPSTTKN